MKVESWSRKASWVLALAVIWLLAYQQKELQLSRANERAADIQVARLALEVSALKLAAQGNEFLIPKFGRGK